MVPITLPFTTILTPAKGSPVVPSFTVPEIEVCAMSAADPQSQKSAGSNAFL
jgi:hypothetical protein